MLDLLKFTNVRSMLDATLKLQPFTLLIGANGAGKSNVLQSICSIRDGSEHLVLHFNHQQEASEISLEDQMSSKKARLKKLSKVELDVYEQRQRQRQRESDMQVRKTFLEISDAVVFKLIPSHAGMKEQLSNSPSVNPDGSGVVRVLDSLKTGDREDLFDLIEKKLCEYIPEIEKLSFLPNQSGKQLQVREKHIHNPVPVSQLSEGTQLIIILLTILYQERPPSLICIEDIDSAMHPRLLEKVIQLCFDLAGKDGHPPIIATTQNPYVVDLFKDHEDAVVVVEKVNGYTTLTTLEEKMESLAEAEAPLGELWFSGAIGGVPLRSEV